MAEVMEEMGVTRTTSICGGPVRRRGSTDGMMAKIVEQLVFLATRKPSCRR
jgi:hypothetical protein